MCSLYEVYLYGTLHALSTPVKSTSPSPSTKLTFPLSTHNPTISNRRYLPQKRKKKKGLKKIKEKIKQFCVDTCTYTHTPAQIPKVVTDKATVTMTI